jgi:hypothetical protein
MKNKFPAVRAQAAHTRAALCGALFFCALCLRAGAEPLYSPTWGFRLDLPEGYEYSGGDKKERFSFTSPMGTGVDLVVYNGIYSSVEELASDIGRRIGNSGETTFFDYRGKSACLMELVFDGREGWGLCVELGRQDAEEGAVPLLAALAYGPGGRDDLAILHLSALDSIAPSEAEYRTSGPVGEFSYPRGALAETPLALLAGQSALIAEHDAEGAQALIDREFAVLRRYSASPLLKEARIRFYRAIYRDSWERLVDAAFKLERYWNAPLERISLPAQFSAEKTPASRGAQARVFAGKALQWVQSFKYERDLMGSDFVNLVSAATEGRGDCDSRAMLWALVLAQADIPAAMMISPEYSHAMGLADLPGEGAHFGAGGITWLVAETTAPVDIGLIRKDISAIDYWFAVIFE